MKLQKIVFVDPEESWEANETIYLFTKDLASTDYLTHLVKNEYRVKKLRNDNNVLNVFDSKTAKYFLEVSSKRASGNDSTGSNGFYYRVPGKAVFTLNQLDKDGKKFPISRELLQIAQFGVVRALPRRFGVLTSEITEFMLHPMLGSISKLAVNGVGLGTDEINALTGVIEASRAEKPDSEITALEDRKKEIIPRKRYSIA